MQTQKPTLELLTCEGAYRDNPTAHHAQETF